MGITQSITDLEQLFGKLVREAIPQGASVTIQWSGGGLCAHVETKHDGAYSQHTIHIRITEDAINTYSRIDTIRRLEADERLARYIAQQFQEFNADTMSGTIREHPLTSWTITDKLLNG